jgi:glycosyltransferase involved in cell wall biosynthesis
MRAFFLSYGYERGLRGDAGGFRKLWELAHALETQGWSSTVFYPKLGGQLPLTPVRACGYPVLDVAILRPLTAYVARLLTAAAMGRRTPPDVVYFRSDLDVSPRLLRPLLAARVVLEVNADVVGFLHAERSAPARRWLAAAAERLNARASDVVVALTPGLARMVVERYRVPATKVHVIPSGTDCGHFTPTDARTARRALDLDPDADVVGFLGLFYRHQGVATLLEAVALLRRARPRLRALIVGDGVMRTAWEERARRLGVADIVRFTGQVPYRQAPLYLNAMDVVVAPFTADRGETSPFKVLDALACARPVVASRIPSIQQLAESGAALVLASPDEPEAFAGAVDGLLASPAGRAELGRRGREFVLAVHDWPRIGQQLAGVLGGAVAAPVP